MEHPDIIKRPQVIYSCYLKLSREGEQYIPDTIFTTIVSGNLGINDGRQEYALKAGDFALYVKDKLAKFTKMPSAETGEFKALSIVLDKETLKSLSGNYKHAATGKSQSGGIVPLESHPLYKGFAESLQAYMESTVHPSEALLKQKARELVMILMETKPELGDILFDFSEPGKIDLKAFMNNNFHFKVDLQRFAYLTGRSLSTFKRDFEKIFSTTPNKWLQQKRLEEARYLLSRGKTVSDVYIEVGFENLSHFSFAFKKAFGKAPSQLVSEE
jgi:AraC-like DNA-binding protein